MINSHKVHAQYTHLAVKIKSGQIYDTTAKREMHKSCSKNYIQSIETRAR